MACGSCSTGGRCGGGCSSGGCGTAGGGCPSRQAFDWLAGLAAPAQHFDLVEVQFKGRRHGFYRLPDALPDVVPGDAVVVEVDRGVDLGFVVLTGEMARLRARAAPARPDDDLPVVLRRATAAETDAVPERRAEEAVTLTDARRLADPHGLDLKLTDAEWQFDRRKLTLYFTAEARVDFRALVRDLGTHFRTRVELRQIGARDETARLGGLGSCGRELCCSTWLTEFRPVTTGAARQQNLPLNPARLSGQCGRLKCCLNYELEQYVSALKRFPRLDAAVVVPERGAGRVGKLDIFRDRVWIELETREWLDLPLDEALPYVQPRALPRPGEDAGRRGGA